MPDMAIIHYLIGTIIGIAGGTVAWFVFLMAIYEILSGKR